MVNVGVIIMLTHVNWFKKYSIYNCNSSGLIYRYVNHVYRMLTAKILKTNKIRYVVNMVNTVIIDFNSISLEIQKRQKNIPNKMVLKI